MTSSTQVWTPLDFEADGKQCDWLRMPYSTDLSGYGVVPIPIVCIRNGAGPTALLMAGSHGDDLSLEFAQAGKSGGVEAVFGEKHRVGFFEQLVNIRAGREDQAEGSALPPADVLLPGGVHLIQDLHFRLTFRWKWMITLCHVLPPRPVLFRKSNQPIDGDSLPSI